MANRTASQLLTDGRVVLSATNSNTARFLLFSLKYTRKLVQNLSFLAHLRKHVGVCKNKPNHYTHILMKLLLCQMTFLSKFNQVLDNLDNSLFRWFNGQRSAKNTAFSEG